MSVCCCQIQLRKGTMPISWLACILWCSVMLSPACGYVIVNSVSWSVTNEVEEELDSSSTEEALPALLEDTTSIWKQSYPASVYKEDGVMRSRPVAGRSKQISSPSRMFSYRKESVKGTDSITPQEQAIRTARFLTHYNSWGFLATESIQEKIQGVPFGNCLLVSDGPINNSTGIPFFYVTSKDNAVTDLMENSMASLTLPEAEGDFCRSDPKHCEFSGSFQPDCYIRHEGAMVALCHPCGFLLRGWMEVILAPSKSQTFLRKNLIDPEDPRCARLTLTGQMIMVPPEEMEFAKQAMFSRHPIMRKWPRHYEWFFMKMNIEHIWLQNWYGGVSPIAVEEYFKAVPSKE